MSTILAVAIIALVVAAIAAGALVVINALRHETEESPAARRAALARVSARARAQSPAPSRREERWFERARFRLTGRWSPGVVTERLAADDSLRAYSARALLNEPQPLTRSRSLDVGEGRRRVVERVEPLLPRFTLLADEVRRSVQAELAEQELARRRAQAGGTFDGLVPSQPPDPFRPVCGDVLAAEGVACTLPAGHRCVHQAGRTYWSRGGEAA